jgi:heme A synthase
LSETVRVWVAVVVVVVVVVITAVVPVVVVVPVVGVVVVLVAAVVLVVVVVSDGFSVLVFATIRHPLSIRQRDNNIVPETYRTLFGNLFIYVYSYFFL